MPERSKNPNFAPSIPSTRFIVILAMVNHQAWLQKLFKFIEIAHGG
jgi:hypothetical protein